MGAVRVTLIVVGLIIVSLLLSMVSCAVQLVTGVQGAISESEQEMAALAQTTLRHMVVTQEAVVITVPLKPEWRVKLQDVQLCGENPVGGDAVGHSSWTVDGKSMTTIDFGDKRLPDSLRISREYQGKCVDQTLTNLRQYYVVDHYEASIGIGPALAKQLGLTVGDGKAYHMSYNSGTGELSGFGNAKIETAAQSMHSNVTVAQLGQVAGVTFSYDAKPEQDAFTVGGKLVRLRFARVE